MKNNRLMLIIALVLLVGKSGTLFASAEPMEIPPLVEHELTALALVTPPLPPVTQWLLERYRQLYPVVSRILAGHTNPVLAVAISPDGNHVVTGSADRTARIWNLAPDLFSLLANLNLEQIRVLQWIHVAAQKGQQLDLTSETPGVLRARKAYNRLPDLIKDLVRKFVILQSD